MEAIIRLTFALSWGFLFGGIIWIAIEGYKIGARYKEDKEERKEEYEKEVKAVAARVNYNAVLLAIFLAFLSSIGLLMG